MMEVEQRKQTKIDSYFQNVVRVLYDKSNQDTTNRLQDNDCPDEPVKSVEKALVTHIASPT